MKNKVYICSPYRGDVERNLELAREYCRLAMGEGFIPVCPHIYFTQFLCDDDEGERRMGIEAGLELLDGCSELWVFGSPTEGMLEEIEYARTHGIGIVVKR